MLVVELCNVGGVLFDERKVVIDRVQALLNFLILLYHRAELLVYEDREQNPEQGDDANDNRKADAKCRVSAHFAPFLPLRPSKGKEKMQKVPPVVASTLENTFSFSPAV